MKSTVLYVALLAAIVVSIFFTYQRSFVWQNFELIDSEAEEVEMDAEMTEEDDNKTAEILLELETATSSDTIDEQSPEEESL